MHQTITRFESYERIRLRLLTSGVLGGVDGCTSIRMLSRLHGEGVTTVCVGLAHAAAQAGNQRVLVVDAAPSMRGVTEMLKLDVNPMAIEALVTTDALPQHIVHAQKYGFDVLRLHGAAIHSPFFYDFWQTVKERYNLILVDAGPLESDGSHGWTRWIDRTVLVIDPESTSYETLERFRSELQSSAVQVSGFIMNKRPFPVPRLIYRMIS